MYSPLPVSWAADGPWTAAGIADAPTHSPASDRTSRSAVPAESTCSDSCRKVRALPH